MEIWKETWVSLFSEHRVEPAWTYIEYRQRQARTKVDIVKSQGNTNIHKWDPE